MGNKTEIISKRCGIGKVCEHYDPNNPVSGCSIFDDRNNCEKSLSNRKAVAKKSKQKQKSHSGGYNFNKPFWAQNLGDEWDDYAWSGDDF